MTTRSK